MPSFTGCGRYPPCFKVLIPILFHAGNTTLSNTTNITCSWATVKKINENLLRIFLYKFYHTNADQNSFENFSKKNCLIVSKEIGLVEKKYNQRKLVAF